MVDMLRHGWPQGTMARLYRSLKYLVYVLLSLNFWFFLQEELVSATHAVTADTDLFTWVQLFSATLDTAAWVLLLLLFELETAVIPDDRLVGRTQWTIHGIRLVCGMAIVSAFFGYVGEWTVFWDASALGQPACELIGRGWTVLIDFDNFVPLDSEACLTMGSNAVVVTGLDQVVATPSALGSAYELGLVDVINSGAWILVVILLEIEVRLQLWGGVSTRFQWVSNGLKVALYLTLAAAAVYWGFEGELDRKSVV